MTVKVIDKCMDDWECYLKEVINEIMYLRIGRLKFFEEVNQ